ncbi:hypothetical protein GC176_17080 [bacterium]|nr:hypothetical protein [bacterium]
MTFQTQCPHCSKILKLKSKSAIGKTAPCPKCKTPFTVEPYEEPVADEWDDAGDDEYGYNYSDEDYGDDYGEATDDYEEVEPAPSRSARRSGSKGKGSKKKKKGGGPPAWLAPAGIGLAVLLGLGLLGGGIYFVIAKLGGGGSNAIDLAWLPGNADMYIHAKPDEMWNAPILAPLRENETFKNAMAQAGQNGQLNLKPEEIASVTVAGVDLGDQMSARVPLFGGRPKLTGQIAKKADPKYISVIRLKRDLTADELAALPGVEKKSHGSSEYYVAGAGLQRNGFYLADSRTLLTGTESELTQAIDRGSSQVRVSRIDFLNPNHQLVMVIAPPKILQPETSATTGTTPGDRLGNALNHGSRAMAFGLSLNQNIDLQVQFDCFDGTSASTIQTEFDAVIADAKSKLSQQSAAVPEPFQGLMNVATQTLNSFQASTSGSQVAINGNVPGAIGDEVKKLAGNPMVAMMLPGLLKGAGGGFGGGMGGAPAAFPGQPPTTPNSQPQAYVPGGPDAATQSDIDAVKAEQNQVLDQLGGIRGRIKSTTGQIQDAVPGGK